jgi:ketosteroid isomerase-like protein
MIMSVSKATPKPKTKNLRERESRIQDNMSNLQTYFDLLFSKNLDKLLDLIHPNIEWLVVPTGDMIKGQEEFIKLSKNHWAASPNRMKKLINLFANEEYGSLEYISGGTLTVDTNFGSIKIAATGSLYELRGCFVLHFTDGRIDQVREYFDMESVAMFAHNHPMNDGPDVHNSAIISGENPVK